MVIFSYFRSPMQQKQKIVFLFDKKTDEQRIMSTLWWKIKRIF